MAPPRLKASLPPPPPAALKGSVPGDVEVDVAVDLASVVDNPAPSPASPLDRPAEAALAALGSQPTLAGPIVEPLPADPIGPSLPAWPGTKPSVALETANPAGSAAPAPAERSSPLAAATTFPDLNSLFEVDDDPDNSGGPQLTTARATSALTSAVADDEEPTAVLRFAKDTRAKDTSLRAPSRTGAARPSLPAPPPMSVPPVRPPTAAPPPGPAATTSVFDRPSTIPGDAASSGLPMTSATATLLAPLVSPAGPSSIPPAGPFTTSSVPPNALGGGFASTRLGATSLGIAPPANPPMPPTVGGSLPPPGNLGAPGRSVPPASLLPPSSPFQSSVLPPPAPAPHFSGTLLSAPPPPSAGGPASPRALDDSVTVMSSRKLETRVVNFVDLVGEAAFSPRVLLAIPLVIATLLLGAWLIFGGRSTGQLTVTVAGPNNQAIGNVQVFVDGQQVCDRSPCRLAELAAGTHLIRAAAEGYTSTADQALVVEAGDALAQNFALAPAKTASVPQNPPPPVQAVPPVPVEPAPVKLDEQPSAAADEAKREVTESAAPTPAKQGGSSAAPRAVAASTPATAKPKKTTGATLNLNSTPASTIVLDGRPLGRTPQNGVSVTAGKHTVVFVNPQRGRKTVKVQVSAGGNKNVSVRF